MKRLILLLTYLVYGSLSLYAQINTDALNQIKDFDLKRVESFHDKRAELIPRLKDQLALLRINKGLLKNIEDKSKIKGASKEVIESETKTFYEEIQSSLKNAFTINRELFDEAVRLGKIFHFGEVLGLSLDQGGDKETIDIDERWLELFFESKTKNFILGMGEEGELPVRLTSIIKTPFQKGQGFISKREQVYRYLVEYIADYTIQTSIVIKSHAIKIAYQDLHASKKLMTQRVFDRKKARLIKEMEELHDAIKKKDLLVDTLLKAARKRFITFYKTKTKLTTLKVKTLKLWDISDKSLSIHAEEGKMTLRKYYQAVVQHLESMIIILDMIK